MEELVKHFKEWCSERVSNPFLKYFTMFLLLWNVPFLISVFFYSGNDKSKYLINEFYVLDWVSLKGFTVPVPTGNFIWGVFISLLLALIFTLFLPTLFNKINKPYFKAIEELRKAKVIYKLNVDEDISKAKKDFLNAKTNEVKQEKELTDENPEIGWLKEFEEFRLSNKFQKFGDFIEAVNDNYGRTIVSNSYSKAYSDIYSICNAYGLIELVEDSNRIGKRLKFTDKGNFFVKTYYKVRQEEYEN